MLSQLDFKKNLKPDTFLSPCHASGFETTIKFWQRIKKGYEAHEINFDYVFLHSTQNLQIELTAFSK